MKTHQCFVGLGAAFALGLTASTVLGEGSELPDGGAMIMSLPFTDTGDTCDNFNDYDEVCPYSGSTAPDVFYTYIPLDDVDVNIILCESGYDTKTYVYHESAPGVFDLVACNDDACSDSAGNPYRSQLDCVPLLAGQVYHIAIDGYGGSCGVYDLIVEECVPCAACPPEGILEGEPPCGDNYNDMYNGGCNSDPFVFQSINCGDVMCGMSGTFTYGTSNYRDTDWFLVTVPEGIDSLTWEAVGEFPLLIFIIDAGSGNCVDYTILGNVSVPFCEVASLTVNFPAPGDYWLWAGPSVFSGIPCESPYVGEVFCLTSGACCFPDESCIVTDPDTCYDMGGEYQGDGTDCGEFTYSWEECGNAFEDISGTGTQLILSDDDGEWVPIGFTFTFYGTPWDDIAVCSNGYLTFGSDLTDFSNDAIPNTNLPNDIICPFWDDLDPGNTGSPATVHYQTLGAEPNRVFVAQWTDVPEFPNEGANTFQALLYEGTSCIEFRYGEFTADVSGTDVTVGIENFDGTVGLAVDASIIVPGTCISICGEAGENPCEITEIELYLDIKPGSCPNSFNKKSKGKVPVALLGEEDFDVTMVDVESLMLSRGDGMGGYVMPIRTNYEDVGTPFDGEDCDCHEMEGDGFMDLTMLFGTQDMVEYLVLTDFLGGEVTPLVLTGTLLDGTPFYAYDCLRFVPGGDKGGGNPDP